MPKDKDTDSVEVIIPENFGSSFEDKNIRAGFIRKVYGILFGQLAVTTTMVCIFCLVDPIKRFYCSSVSYDSAGIGHCVRVSHEGAILYGSSYVVFLVVYIMLACCKSVRRKFPINLILLGIFTMALSLFAASVSVFHDVYWVLMALGITALISLGLTLFACQTKWDITGKGGYLFAAAMALFVFGILFSIFASKGYSVIPTIYAGLVALISSLFLIYHTQWIVGGKKYSLTPEEPLLAAIMLYVDMVNIFLAILGLGGRR